MFNARFPGFDTDIHGLVEETVDGVRKYYVDCVRGTDDTDVVSADEAIVPRLSDSTPSDELAESSV